MISASSRLLPRIALIVVAPLAALTLWTVFHRASGPALSIEPAAFSLGDVAEGAQAHATVTIRNRSRATLYFERVDKSCDCTEASVPDALPPGASAPLTITLDTSGKRGPLRKSIALQVRGWPKDPVTVPIVGSVHEELRVEPRRLKLGELACREKRTVALTVTRVDGKPLSLSAPGLPPTLAATFHNAAPPVVRVSAVLTAPDAPGEYSEFVHLRTDDAALPSVEARLDYTVEAVYALKPAFAHFGLNAKTAPAAIDIQIVGPKAALKLLKIPPEVSATLSGNRLTIRRKPGAPGHLTTAVQVATDNPRQPQIVVPVYSFFSAPRGR